MIDLDKLVLVPGKTVYTIFVDCSVINADGNLFDATSYAVVSALVSTKLPVFEMQDDKVVDTGNEQDPPINTIPISITAVRIGDVVILDPSAEEEACMDAKNYRNDKFKWRLYCNTKGITGSFTIEQIKTAER